MSTVYTVVGGAGAMGKITVRDLYETLEAQDEIRVADYDYGKAEALVHELSGLKPKKGGRAVLKPVQVNVKDRDQAVGALQGTTILINSAPYEFNLSVMELALALRAHYVDLGGLFHVTRKQVELDSDFRAIGRLALLGMGAAPGITNILARFGADKLDQVKEIHCRVGSMDATRYEPKPALAVSYSLATILEEFSYQPAVFTKGQFQYVEPMSGDVVHRFPAPIGARKPMYTIHSEVATLPLSFKEKGVKEVSFKIAFDPEFTDRVRFLRDLGLGSAEIIRVGETQVRPRDVVNRVAMNQPQCKQVGKLKQYEVVRSVVKGISKGKKVTWIVDCHTAGMPEWGVGLDIDTGSPPAIAAQMIARGEIQAVGALPAEVCVPPEAFFQHLKRRKMKVVTKRASGWAFKV